LISVGAKIGKEKLKTTSRIVKNALQGKIEEKKDKANMPEGRKTQSLAYEALGEKEKRKKKTSHWLRN